MATMDVMNENNEKLKEKILEAFIPSREMADYLKTRELSESDLFEIIAGSLTCLDCKLYWIRRLFSEKRSASVEKEWNQKRISELTGAISELACRPGEIFTLTSNWYDEDIKGEKSSEAAPFSNYGKVIECIEREMAEDRKALDNSLDPMADCCWYTLKKWAVDEKSRKYVNTYTYYLIGMAVVYYQKAATGSFENWFGGITEPNLPIPFRQGDIVDIDCRPFHPVVPVLIVTVGDNKDCCCVQGMVMEPDGKWRISAVKHNTILGDLQIPMVSPLYSLRKSIGKLSGEMEFLHTLADELKWEQAYAGTNMSCWRV